MSPSAFMVIGGGGDVVDTLTELLERAKAGEITAFAIATIEGDILGGGWAHAEGMESAFARILASVACLQHELLTNGL